MKSSIFVLATLALLSTTCASPVNFEKRRFGQEHTTLADKTTQTIKDCVAGTKLEEIAGNTSGAMVRALLAKAGACDQQNQADKCLDIIEQRANITSPPMSTQQIQGCIDNCVAYRKLERNTIQDGLASELCKEKPKHERLVGVVQDQDPTGNGQVGNGGTGNDGTGNSGNGQMCSCAAPSPVSTAAPSPDSTKAPSSDSTKAPSSDSTEAPSSDSTEAPSSDSTKAPSPVSTKAPSSDSTKAPSPVSTAAPSPDSTKAPSSDSTAASDAITNPIGGIEMPDMTQVGNEFEVKGNKFKNQDTAHGRQCDIQHNLCADNVNLGKAAGITVGDCDNQNQVCKEGPVKCSNCGA